MQLFLAPPCGHFKILVLKTTTLCICASVCIAFCQLCSKEKQNTDYISITENDFLSCFSVNTQITLGLYDCYYSCSLHVQQLVNSNTSGTQ